MARTKSFDLKDEAATLKAAAVLARLLEEVAASAARAVIVYLQGDLGAGKTTFCRGFIKALGYEGVVKSPTFTIVEPYSVKGLTIYHFDLYRLSDPEELWYLGGRDYFEKGALCLIEWPSLGEGVLPEADVVVNLEIAGDGRKIAITCHRVLEDLPENFWQL